MRFIADGPSIPHELLEQRDAGNVVFFCGAGISMPAGLPSFRDLTSRVMRALGTGTDAKSRLLFERSGDAANLDQVFNLLQQEYRRDEVEDVVTQILRTPRSANIEAHSIILRLSQNARRQAQVVTTNFDLLFERSDKSLRIHLPPALPDLGTVGSFDGVVYLHGRRARRGSTPDGQQRLVLSSADFGRAYLADGWATRFVRDLLQSYVIVLVGYSATDPPVRYLLEGLHSRGDGLRNIYAFDHGPKDEVEDRWRSLGVRALPYAKESSAAHVPLWDSLRAWAVRADDPEAWRRSIVDLSLTNPAHLEPHQRGEVVALLRTSQGAALFSSAVPPPAAEWLCVFDRLVRYGEPDTTFGREEVDPLMKYGLDDDPPRPEKSFANDGDVVGDDLIARLARDERTDQQKRLAGISARASDRLPARLGHLSHWFTRVASSPAALWWAAGYNALHPQLLAALEWMLQHNQDSLDDRGTRAWRLLLARFDHTPEQRHDWYRMLPRVGREGWTTQVLRDFESVIEPYLTAKRPFHCRLDPPSDGESLLRLRDIVDFEIAFPGHDRETLEVPGASLPSVFEIVRQGLHRASQLLAEIETNYWHTASFLPDDDAGERYPNEASQYFNWARILFDRLAIEHPDVARAEVRRWPADDQYFFDKFRIYAWLKSDLIPGSEAALGLLSLADDGFWNEYHRRELLHTLRARWIDMSVEERRAIESRILAGQSRWSGEEDGAYTDRIHRTAVKVLGWLERHGCELTRPTSEAVLALRASVSGWVASWEEGADGSLDTRVGWVATNSDPSALVEAPLAAVLGLAARATGDTDRGFVSTAPFDGLVSQHLRRALAALSLEARGGRYPLPYWRSLLGHWPKDADSRLLAVCAGRLCGAPDDVLVDCRYEVVRWFSDHAQRLADIRLSVAFELFDRVVASLSSAGAEATRSAIGDVTVRGKIQPRSRRTYDHAINSPTGHLAQGLFAILDGMKSAVGSGLPLDVQVRLERLLQMTGDAGDYVICESTVRLRWLYSIDPRWTREHLVPLFDPTNPAAEPAWNGLLTDGQVERAELFALLKPYFVGIFTVAGTWNWEHDSVFSRLVSRLLVACYWRRHDRRYVTFAEARPLLRLVGDAGRAHGAWFLATAFREDPSWWSSFGRPFLQKAWPRESRFQTPTLSERLAFLAEQAGDEFPDVVRTVLPLLVPVDQLDMTLHRARRADTDGPLVDRFPREMLTLLDRLMPIEPKQSPYGLDGALEAIARVVGNLRDDLRWKRLKVIAERG